MSELSSIKIPKEVYVGFQGRRTVDEVPLGFMTPYDTTKAGDKRRATVDSWAAGWGAEKTFNSVILQNTPMIGFKIGRAIRRHRSWGGNASYVRIEDPRGFELEISIENMVMVMDQNIIEDGEIMQECVWGREGGKNILLPTNSEPYKASLDTTKRLNAVLSLKDVKPGSKVKLVTGETGIYYGSLFPIYLKRNCEVSDTTSSLYCYSRNETISYVPEIRGIKRYLLATDGDDGQIINVYTAIKVAEVLEEAKEKLKPEDIEKIIATKIGAGEASFQVHVNGDYYDKFIGLSANKELEYAMVQNDITEAEAQQLKIARGHNYVYASRSIYMEDSTGQCFLVTDSHDRYKDNFLLAKSAVRSYRNSTLHQPKAQNSYWSRNDPEIKVYGGFVGCKAEIIDAQVVEQHWTHQEWHTPDEHMKRLFTVDVVVKLESGWNYVYDLGHRDY